MAIRSKFSNGFWIQRFGFFLLLVLVIFLLFKAGWTNGGPDWTNYYTWFACFVTFFGLYQVFLFYFSELFVMLISEEYIVLRFFILRKPWVIRYDEIQCISGSATENERYGLSWSNRIFVVTLSNDREFVFTDNRYKNYDECKFWIQEYFSMHEAKELE